MNQPSNMTSQAQIETLERQIDYSNFQRIELVKPCDYRNINLRKGTFGIFEGPCSVYPHVINDGSLTQSPTTGWHLNRDEVLGRLERVLRCESLDKPPSIMVYKVV